VFAGPRMSFLKILQHMPGTCPARVRHVFGAARLGSLPNTKPICERVNDMEVPSMQTRLSFVAVLLTATACATASPSKDAQNVAVIEGSKEGETHLALPTVLPDCEHLGMTRVSIPEGVPGLPLEILNTLKQKAANMGGNTLVLLPGRRVVSNSLRGSVFNCQDPPTD
jgi:hypothetical protein